MTNNIAESHMYSQRTKNIPVFRGCSFGCVYCAFKRMVQMNRKCPKCAAFEPHSHMEALQRTPPRTKEGEFLTVGLSSEISFMNTNEFCVILSWCREWGDRTFLIQSKNPMWFLQFSHLVPDNVILGTTIETNREAIGQGEGERSFYQGISKAPLPKMRYETMLKLNCRKAVTIEPILDFDLDIFANWIKDISPEFVYIGYANDRHDGKRLKLSEPSLAKAMELITILEEAGIEVRKKTIRGAWWEEHVE